MADTPLRYGSSEYGDDEINVSTPAESQRRLIGNPDSLLAPESSVMTQRPTSDSVADESESLDLILGEVPETVLIFAPFKLVRQYPYLYVGKANQKRVADFFTNTLFTGYSWNFFSQYYPGTSQRDPLLLVSTNQFEQYLDLANRTLATALTIPKGSVGKRYMLTFGELGSPRPRFIGRVDSTSAFEEAKARARTLSLNDLSSLSPAAKRFYCDKMENVFSLLKGGQGKKDPEVIKEKRIEKQKHCGRMIKRVQRYLGLRQAMSHVASTNLVPEQWDVSKPSPFKPREHIRFVSVDFEAYEKCHRLVTEIGLSVLDTEDLIGVPPGEKGENWLSHVRVHHLRIRERSHLVNSKYIQGCPEAFNFGESQMVFLEDIYTAVCGIIDGETEHQIPVVMVGHDLKHDLDYLVKIGYDAWSSPHIIDDIDTKAMFQRIEQAPNGRGLSTVCAELDIHGRNYHNAGNDAFYTLQAMITMAVKRTVEGADKKKDPPTSNDGEWTDGDMDDGGPAVRPGPQSAPKKRGN
ncbi:hypothetical protein F4861DRAFT_541096 [Xylaria intraflava]|nr:hypothetical protein F4861DRAFT_541096 [Xylaria intraflava]